MRLAAVVPAALRAPPARATTCRDDGGAEVPPPVAVLVLHADPAAPENGAAVSGYSAQGVLARESWYLTVDEARSCAAREYAGRLGEWRPLGSDASPLDALADARC